MNKRKAAFSVLVFLLIVSFLSASTCFVIEQGLEKSVNRTKSTLIENCNPTNSMNPSLSDSWIYNEYIVGIEGIYDTFNYFNLSKYGGGWQYAVTRDWSDIAFTNGKFIGHDSESIVGLLSAYNLTGNAKYLRYAEGIWNWDHQFFFDDVYGGYYVRLNQDNSIAIGDKGMFEHGWFGLATVQLYIATCNSTYLNQIAYLYDFVTNNFYDVGDGSYYGALSRDLGILVSDIDTNWCAPYARFLIAAYGATENSTYGDMAIELVENLMDYAYDSQYGWIVNRITSDWSSFSNSAKGWYDILQTFIDAYQIFGNTAYLTFVQSCFDDIQQANSTVGYLMEMNRDWTSITNNQLLGEEDPGVAIAYLRIANALQNTTIMQEAYRYKDAIYSGLYDPIYGGIYSAIYSSGSQSTWKQWCGAGRVMEMLAEFAISAQVQSISILVWGDADPNGQERAGRTIAENLEEIGLNVTFVSDFTDLENELSTYHYQSLILVAMPWSDTYSNIPTSTENLIESLISNGELGLVGFHDIIWQNANNPILENIFGGTLSSFSDRDSTYSIVNTSHPVAYGLPSSFALDDDQLLMGSWNIDVEIIMEADYLNTPVVVANKYDNGRSVYIAAGGGSGYSSAIADNDTNLVQVYRNAVFWSCNISYDSETPLSNDNCLPVPMFLHHETGVSTSYFSIYWILPQGYNENDFEYEIEISNEEEFNDASSVTTTQSMQSYTVNKEDWYYLRVRSVNETHYGDWSDTTRIAVMVSPLILDGYETYTITENSGDHFVILEIDSHFYFNYSIEMSGEIQEVGYFREENITFSVLDFPVGTYYLTLTVVDVTGMEYQSEFALHIIQNLSEVISTVITTLLIGVILLFCGIVIYVKYPRKKWKEGVDLQIESSGNIPLEYLANSNDVAIATLTTYLTTVDYAIVSNDNTVYSTAFILSEIQSKQLRDGRVQISEFIEEHNLDRDEFIALVLKRSEELVLTENLVYNKSSIVDILKERLLETNSLDIELFFQETEISSNAVESLLRETGVRYYSDNNGMFKCIEYDGLKIINHALENGFVFVNQVIENSSVPLRELKSYLSTRRDDVVFSSSLDLLVSAKWLSGLRDDVFEQGEVEIDDLAIKYGTTQESMLSILQYFLHGQVSSDNSTFRVKSHEVDKSSTSTTPRWTQPSLRSVYHADPPPSGIQYQAPVNKAGESGTASCIQICGCIWLPISLVMIFITPFGSLAIAVTAMLGFLWKYLTDNATKNPVRGQIIREPGRLLPDGRYMCPYCHTRRMYAEEEMNDRGSVYCKECRAVFPLKETYEEGFGV